ncbi:hypothetical protein [Halalkalicoccus salilacus]|uniref:hypothetical protein n=1 Tax=Halalkalicoccus TaxID=332246 RepID=UPI002F967E81
MTSDTAPRPPASPEDRPPDARRNNSVPGRKTRPAYSRRRRIWFGWGQTGSAEKTVFGLFLHDVPYVFLEVFGLSLPASYYILNTVFDGGFGATGAAFVAWVTMTIVATLIHMGLIRPLATETLGWVSITPFLVGVRLVYYNLVLLVAAYASVALATLVAYPPISLVIAALVGCVAMMAFPRLAEAVARRRTR